MSNSLCSSSSVSFGLPLFGSSYSWNSHFPHLAHLVLTAEMPIAAINVDILALAWFIFFHCWIAQKGMANMEICWAQCFIAKLPKKTRFFNKFGKGFMVTNICTTLINHFVWSALSHVVNKQITIYIWHFYNELYAITWLFHWLFMSRWLASEIQIVCKNPIYFLFNRSQHNSFINCKIPAIYFIGTLRETSINQRHQASTFCPIFSVQI